MDISTDTPQAATLMEQVLFEVKRVVVGQDRFLERVMVALLAQGHLLVEGVPGLAKTLTVKTLAQVLEGQFKRIQFTPDLVPADLVGTRIYNHKTGDFSTALGPVFANLLLADEINRAPAKVQSALLEAMQERQVTIGDTTYPLPNPFLVMATENPLEQEGTYPLPEAQVDRFLFKVLIGYPTQEEERRILDTMAFTTNRASAQPLVEVSAILRAREVVDEIYLDDKIKDYILSIVFATREPAKYNLQMRDYIRYGASPRATLALTVAARAHAFLQGRGYVIPQDVKSIAPDVLRHRLIVSYEAEADDITPDSLIEKILAELPVP